MEGTHDHKRICINAIVHVIEARHLRAKDSNALSDPFVRVTVAGKRQSTEIRREQINATWDQVFMFQDMEMSVKEFENELVVLQVFDANTFLRNELIGQFSFGLSQVRNQPAPHRHQIYRRWLVLTDPEEPLEEQGYLQVSVTILGPGDVPPAHNRQDDYSVGGRTTSMREEKILRNPQVKRRGYNFSVKVFRAEGLPITDTWNKSCDPFVVVKFNGVVARTPHQRHTTTPNWNHLLVLPVFTPCFSDTIEILLYDFVRGQPDRLLASFYLKFTSLLGDPIPPSWFNFYGKVDEEESASGWICDLIRSAKDDIDTTAYMGRILMSLNTTLTDSPISVNKPCAPIKGPKTEKYVLWVDIYRGSELPLALVGGSAMIEVQFGPPENKRQSDWCSMSSRFEEDILESTLYSGQQNSIRFTCTGDDLAEAALGGGAVTENSTGPCQFKEIQVALPQIYKSSSGERMGAQLFDIIINVYVKGLVGGMTRVGFLKIKPMDVFGYNNPPEWHPVRGLVDRKGKSVTPGQLLISASFGTVDGANQIERKPMMAMSGNRYQLRAHIYQARNLRPTNPNGLSSAHVQVSLGGKTARIVESSKKATVQELLQIKSVLKSKSKNNQGNSDEEIPESMKRTNAIHDSLNPVWYETLLIDDVQLPDPLSLAPDVEIRVADDINASSGACIGRVKFPASLCTLDMWPTRKRPRWLKIAASDLTTMRTDIHANRATSILQTLNQKNQLNELEAENDAGDILVKLQLIPIEDVPQYPLWAHKWPRVIPSALFLGSVGLRRLEEYGFFGSIDEPYVRVSVSSIPNMLAPVSIAAHAINSAENQGGISNRGVLRPRRDENTPQAANEDGTNNNTGDDSYMQMKEDKWSYTEVPFANDYDEDGRLSKNWVKASDAIEASIANLHRMYVDVPSRVETLYHPVSTGIAIWTNKSATKEPEEDNRPPNNQEEEELDEEMGGTPPSSFHTNTKAEQTVVEKERARRTFFSRATLNINMPVDPFYAPSMTIEVMDSRIFGDVVIATATISTREFASVFLYTDAMKQRAATKEAIYVIPRFAMTTATRQELHRIAEEETYDEDMTYFTDKEALAAEAEKQGPGLQLISAAKDAALEQKNKMGSENSESKSDSPTDAVGFFYDDVAEGHYELPNHIQTSPDEINIIFEDRIEEFVLGNGLVTEDESEDFKKPGVMIWPHEDDATREANSRVGILETHKSMEPCPFHAFTLYRGTFDADDRKIAGIFKASVVIRPDDQILDELNVVVDDFRPPSNEDGETLPRALQTQGRGVINADLGVTNEHVKYMPVQENDLLRVEKVFDTLVLGEKIIYRPEGKYEVVARGHVPKYCVDPLQDPYSSLYISPDVQTVVGKDERPRILPIVETANRVQFVKVRVYLVACSQLAAKSLIGGTSDPYAVVTLNVPPYLKDVYRGQTYHNDRANYKESSLDPYFGLWYELDVMFPDVSELEVQIWNANYISDDLIGSTKIDLEDRWFNPQWHELKYQRKKIKEFRPLTKPGTNTSQGIVEMWVEMYRPEDAVNAPIVDIRAPSAEMWELRVVVWETRRVPLYDDHNYANLYVSGELTFEGLDGRTHNDQSYETDTHTGLKDGRGIYNYRMLFKLEAPCKLPRLKLKVWERWLLDHTVMGEANIDLTWLVREASRTQQDVIDRTRAWFQLSHPNMEGSRGDLDIQMSLVKVAYAEAHPVGNARDPPNENPFLPDPPRESIFAAVFRSVGWRQWICCACVLIIPLVIILALVVK